MGLNIYLYDPHKPLYAEEIVLWEGGITHNLTTMAEKAGLYKVLWRPEEIFTEKDITAETLLPKKNFLN